ncbi:hypothetical protein [uncultured Ruminococcus sp.]|uniref:hypothetical protein n=1 Tax=uncultured Ruminococcus sp. TaxID=165186 RepID=UPI0025CF619E|nr:hypothetical protein [uncultured Ruminococcus sp.]
MMKNKGAIGFSVLTGAYLLSKVLIPKECRNCPNNNGLLTRINIVHPIEFCKNCKVRGGNNPPPHYYK